MLDPYFTYFFFENTRIFTYFIFIVFYHTLQTYTLMIFASKPLIIAPMNKFLLGEWNAVC